MPSSRIKEDRVVLLETRIDQAPQGPLGAGGGGGALGGMTFWRVGR